MPETVRSLGEEAKELLEQAAHKIDDMVELAEEEEGGGEGPTPPEPGGGGGDFEGVPSGPGDARFANCRPRSRIDATSGTYEDFEIRDNSGKPLLRATKVSRRGASSSTDARASASPDPA